MTEQMPKAYEPKAFESGWMSQWMEVGLFTADPASPKPKYSICLPPPNVTGELHMGHALNSTVQDVWARYRRMTGYEVLFLPGSDHAAIATQNAIERKLSAEGTTKEELGRAAFEELVEEWYRKIGSTIVSQLQELGASLDYSRQRFTMDSDYVRAVQAAFVHFFDKGWLYRGWRIVNWCPRCQSAISDLEVAWEEVDGALYSIRYQIQDGSSIVIATTRPETMLFDTAIAVNPNDERYQALIGQKAILPLVGREIPVIGEPEVEKDFGTGALKVTPGHDPLDYEIGQRHHLELINGMHPDGTLNVPSLPQYNGLTALEARARVIDDLTAEGYLVEIKPYLHQVGHCDRCGTVLEPMVSEQWFLRMSEMAQAAIAASEAGRIHWHPQRYERTYLDWLRGLKDWCVSRQLWLGHRIPVFTCPDGHVFASADFPDACRECGKGPLSQDPDVLDTWFSSALWPFATLGWPDDTPALRAFYPTDMNCTAREIINLWVSRMIMTGLEFRGEIPFSHVAIHCVVQTVDGKRMSKSKGTGIDPREMVAKYGADALRAWSASIAMSSQDVRFDESRIDGFRRFSNKLWNATRLVLGGVEGPCPMLGTVNALEDRWILSELQETVRIVTDGIEEFHFHSSVGRLYSFAWNQFCDWYLEAAKPRLRAADPAAQATALIVLDTLMRLLHPFMPFVTEEIWHRLPGERGYLDQAQWPAVDPIHDRPEARSEFAEVISAVEEIRAARQAAGAPPKGGQLMVTGLSEAQLALLQALAGVQILPKLDGPGTPLSHVNGTIVFPSAARGSAARNQAELGKLNAELARIEAKLSNPEFVAKAPEAVVDKERAKLAEVRESIERLS